MLNIQINNLVEEQHYSIATTYENMSKAFLNLDKNDEALEYLEKSLNLKIHHFGENHFSLAKFMVIFGKF